MSRPQHRRAKLVALIGSIALFASACAAGGPARSSAPSADPTKDKLAQIIARGTLVGYAELDYPPQSIKVEGAQRAATTKCLLNQMTAAEATGFDVETTKLVAKGLGVEACSSSRRGPRSRPAGGAIGSTSCTGPGAINATRMEHLWMTVPYY